MSLLQDKGELGRTLIVYDFEIDNGFFFFKQKTAYEIYQCDWSSDVCSSDLLVIL